MNLLERIKSFFKKEPPPEILTKEITETTALKAPDNEVIAEAIETVSVLAEARDEPLPHWLSSEDALRDEGVIFGLSDAEAEEKTTVIRSFFRHQTADIEKEVEHLSEKIGELNLFIQQKESRIEVLKAKIENLESQSPEDHNLLRTSVGLLLAIGMCVGNFFLIDHSLTPSFSENHTFIAIGVLLAGMFNLFGRFSFFHEKNSSVSWRQLLEEISLPFAAAFFVFTQSLGNQSIWQSIALFLFIFSLFMFSGKLVLSNLSVIKSDSLAWTKNVRLGKDQITKKDLWEEEILEFEQAIDNLRVEKWHILPSLNQAEASLERYHSKRDSLIKLFESEFRLARSYRDKLSGNQLKRILE
jgi:uncharacterized membrane protein HdeD (DUF308 family)